MITEVVIIRKSEDILNNDRLARLIEKVEEQISKTNSRPQVKIIIR